MQSWKHREGFTSFHLVPLMPVQGECSACPPRVWLCLHLVVGLSLCFLDVCDSLGLAQGSPTLAYRP